MTLFFFLYMILILNDDALLNLFCRIFFNLQKKMAEKKQQSQPNGFSCFEKYRDFQLVNETELDFAINYICGNLNSPTLNYGYWYDMYSYTTKSRIVLRFRKRRGDVPVVKLGECLCQGEVIDFLKNQNRKCNCSRGCASVYFDKVF